MTKKVYNLRRSTPEQMELLLTFEQMVRLSRRQMAIHDKRKDINGLNIAIRNGAIKPESIKRIIEGERKRLASFLNEMDTAKGYIKLQELLPISFVKMSKIVVDILGGNQKTIAGRMRQHGPSLEEKQVICEFQEKMINIAFKLVEDV